MAQALYSNYQSGLMYATFYKQNYPTATGLALLLCDTPPTVTSVHEVPNVGSYARQALPQTAAMWSYRYPDSGIVYNNLQISFPVATANIGYCSGIAIADCISYGGGITATGQILFYGSISPAKDISTNDQIIISPSALSVRMY